MWGPEGGDLHHESPQRKDPRRTCSGPLLMDMDERNMPFITRSGDRPPPLQRGSSAFRPIWVGANGRAQFQMEARLESVSTQIAEIKGDLLRGFPKRLLKRDKNARGKEKEERSFYQTRTAA